MSEPRVHRMVANETRNREFIVSLTFDYHEDEPEIHVRYVNYTVVRVAKTSQIDDKWFSSQGTQVLAIDGHEAICDYFACSPILAMMDMTDSFGRGTPHGDLLG